MKTAISLKEMFILKELNDSELKETVAENYLKRFYECKRRHQCQDDIQSSKISHMNSSVSYSLIDDSESEWKEEVLNEQISSKVLNCENEERER